MFFISIEYSKSLSKFFIHRFIYIVYIFFQTRICLQMITGLDIIFIRKALLACYDFKGLAIDRT